MYLFCKIHVKFRRMDQSAPPSGGVKGGTAGTRAAPARTHAKEGGTLRVPPSGY